MSTSDRNASASGRTIPRSGDGRALTRIANARRLSAAFGGHMQERFDTAIVAVGTNLMHRFAAAFRFFDAIAHKSGFVPVKFISFFISLPFAKLSQLSFYFATTALDRKIGRLGGHKFGLNFYDCLIPLTRIGYFFQSLCRINKMLERTHTPENLGNHHSLHGAKPTEIMRASGEGVEPSPASPKEKAS